MPILNKLPAGGLVVVKTGRKFIVYLIEARELGELEIARTGRGRRVYATPDGKLFTDADEAAAHLAQLHMQKPVEQQPLTGV